MTARKVNGFILLTSIASSAMNIVPLLTIPLAAAALSLSVGSIADRKLLFRPFRGVPGWFLLFAAYSILVAALLGVDVLNPALYRREFKFLAPFGYLVLAASLPLPAALGSSIKRLLPPLGFASLAWLLLATGVPSFRFPALYPTLGSMWEPAGKGTVVYLGPFISHSAAGGFYSALALLQIGLLRLESTPRGRAILAAGALSAIVCLLFTGSRSFLLATAAVTAVISARNTPMRSAAYQFILAAAVALLCGAGLLRANFNLEEAAQWVSTQNRQAAVPAKVEAPVAAVTPQSKAEPDPDPRKGYDPEPRARNVEVRFKLWRLALLDFAGSPLFGVGPSRFDDDLEVLHTMPEWDPAKPPRGSSRYLSLPLFHMNIGTLVAHTDQHAHNTYLNVLAEGGLALAAIFVVMFARLVGQLIKVHASATGDLKGLCEGSLYALACVAIASLFGNNLLAVIPMATIFSISGYIIGQGSERSSSPAAPARQDALARFSSVRHN